MKSLRTLAVRRPETHYLKPSAETDKSATLVMAETAPPQQLSSRTERCTAEGGLPTTKSFTAMVSSICC